MKNRVLAELNIENMRNNFVETKNIKIAYIKPRT